MGKKNLNSSDPLSQKAIDRLKKGSLADGNSSHSEADLLRIIRELEIHQAELEIRNEELLNSKEAEKLAAENCYKLYEFAPSAYLTLSAAGVISNLNNASVQILGEERPKLVNTHFTHLVSNDSLLLFQDFLNRVFSLNCRESCEIELLMKDKPAIYVQMEGIRSDDGESCLAIFQDITQRKLDEHNLHQSDERYKSLFLNNHTVMLIIDPVTGSIKDANPVACSYYGWAHAQLCQMNISAINTLTPEEIIYEMNLAREEKRKHFFFKHRLASGEIREVEVHSGPIRFGDSELLYSHVQDITERKLMEMALQKSEEKFRKLVENINDVIFEVDALGFIKYISSPIYKILGYTSEELTGRNFVDFVGFSSEILLKRLALIDQYSDLEGEYQIFKKSGEPCWIRLSTKRIYENGVFLGGSGTLIDITGRKHTEEALRTSSQKWEAIIATSTDGIGMASIDGKIQFLSDNIAKMCGYSSEEKSQYIGGSFFDFIDPSCHSQLTANLQKLLVENQANEIREYIAIKKDKSRFYVELNSTVILNPTGKPESILYFVRDITERKAIEKALTESEQKFKSIVQSQAEGIGLVNQDEVFEFVNPAAAKIFETTIDELTGSSLYDYLNPDEIAKISQQTSQRKIGITNDYELQIVTKEGNIRYIEVSVSPRLDESNNYAGAYGIFRNITDRKLVQEALKEKTLLLSNLIINMQEGILLEDSNRKIVLTNQLFCDLFSIPAPPDALIGADCSESAEQTKTLFKDPDKFLTRIQKVLADRKAILNDELELADGRFFERDYIPTYLDNAYNGHLWKYRDITERKHSQQKISQQNERLNAIITAMPDLIFVIDQFGNNMEYYTNTPDKLLAPIDKLVGLNIEALFDPETAQDHLQKIHECIDQRKLVSYEYKVDLVNSSAFYEARLVPLGASNVLAFIRDVSEKKQQENEIKKLYLAIEQSPVSILITDLAARIEYVNPAFLATTGYSRAEVIGNNPRILKSGKTEKSVYEKLWKTITAGKIWEGEWQDKKKNGELFWEHVSINPIISEDGKITHYLGVKQDVTQRKQAEEEIRDLNANLELRINERTVQLSEINGVLQIEIAERRRASEAMAEALDRLNKIADQVPGVVYQYLMNPDGSSCFPYASEGIRAIYRVTPQEVVVDASAIYSRIHPADFENIAASIQYSAANLTLWRHEYRVKFDDGTVNWLLGNAFPQHLVNGAVLWHGFITDITDRKQTEEALISSRRSYQTVLENIKEIIFQTDANGLWVFLNKSWEEVTGFTVEESMGQLFVNYVHPDDRQRNMDLFQPLITRQKEHCRHQVRYLTKDGGYRWIEVYARLGLNEKDEITGTYGTLQDITDRKEAEDNLKQISSRLALAVQAGGVGVWEYDVFNSKFLWDNQMFTLYGIEPENFSGAYQAWKDGVHPDDRERCDEEIRMAIRGEKEFDTEFRVLWPDGTIRNIRALAVLHRDNAGEPLQLIGTNWDITAQKKTEQEIIQARNDAEKANLAKSEFLSRMSHELRTPLNSILGFAQLMEMGDLIPAHKKGVKHILNSGTHLLKLINEVLDLSRIEAGMLSLSLEPVRINGVINEMIDMVQPLANARNIELNPINSSIDNYFVRADRQSLRQVLLNLLNNSIKYNREGGSVIVETELREPLNGETASLRISVTDNGYGISAPDISKLFKPFVRVGTGKTVAEGTGLGLALVQKLIDAMGGTLGVDSIFGEGSTFWVELPQSCSQLENIQGSTGLTVTENSSDEQIGTILYIEDNIENVELVEQILFNERPNIQLTTNMLGNNALHLATISKPDLILLDLDLPDIHGSEVIKLLLGDPITADIPIVIISADAMPTQINKLLKSGACNYLTKPLNIISFLNMVDSFIFQVN